MKKIPTIIREGLLSAPKQLKKVDDPPFDTSEVGEYFSSLDVTKNMFLPKEKDALTKTILVSIFQNENYEIVAKNLFASIKSTSKPVCAKILTSKDIGFKCLECEKDPTCIICKDCFDNGDHRGHRIVVQKSVSGCCDCGDPDAWRESGFCNNHPGYAKFKSNATINNLPENFRTNFTLEISKALYYLSLFIEKLVAEGSLQAQPVGFLDILDAIEFCGQQSTVIFSLVSQILKQPYQGKCLLYHNCKNLREKEYSGDLKECQCTLLEILFRNQRFLTNNEQKKFEEFMIKMFLDYEFKKIIAENFVKCLHFIYNYDSDGMSIKSEPHVSSLAVQLFTAEEFAVIAIRSNYSMQLIELLQLVVEKFSKNLYKKEGSFGLFFGVYRLLQYISQKSQPRLMLVKLEGFLEKLLETVASLHYIVKFSPDMSTPFSFEEYERSLLFADLEFYLTKYCDLIFEEIAAIPDPETKSKHYRKIGLIFKEIFLTQKDPEKFKSFHIPVHRVFAQFIKCGSNSFETKKIKSFLLESLALEENELSKLSLKIFKDVLDTYGFVKDQEKRCWEKYGPRLDAYVRMYNKLPRMKFFDLDFFLMQSVARFVSQDSLFLCFVSNFSSFPPLAKFIKKALTESDHNVLRKTITKLAISAQDKLLGKLEEMASLYLQLSIEDIEYANLLTKSEKLFGDNKNDDDKSECLSPDQVSIYRRLLINVFQFKSSYDLKGLKKVLATQILEEKLNIEIPLMQVATFDKIAKTFQIKPEYKNVYEPFGCMKDPQLQIEIIDNLKNKFKGSDDLDLIAGKNSFLYEIPGNSLFELQLELFSPMFFAFFKKILSSCIGIERTSAFFFRPFLKLIHLGLFHLENRASLSLKPILTDHEMVEILKSASADGNFSMYVGSIEKMLALITKLHDNKETEMDIESTMNFSRQPSLTPKIDVEAAKKKQMELKMKFMQKQKQFMSQHSQHLSEEQKCEEKKSEDLICYLCHSKIDQETQSFGVPGFACHSNIHEFASFQTKLRSMIHENVPEFAASLKAEERRFDLKSQNFSSYTYLNSCYHVMHKACFETSRTSLNNIEFHFNNELEFFCKVCKKLSNVFIESYLSNQKKLVSSNEEDLIKPEVRLDSIDAFLNCLKSMMTEKSEKSNLKESDSDGKNLLFDTLIMLEILMSEKNSNAEEKEDSILEMTEKSFEYAIKTIDILGVKHFITKNLELYKSLREMYLRFYGQYISNTKKTFSREKYEKMFEWIDLLKDGKVGYDFRDELQRTKEEENNFITLNLDSFIYNSLVHLAITSQLSVASDYLEEVLSRISFLMILQAMLQIYWVSQIKSAAYKTIEININHFLKELKENQVLKAELAKNLLPLLRRLVVMGILLDPQADASEAKKFEREEFYEDIEELDFYLKTSSLFKTTSSQIMSEEILEKCLVSKDMLERHFQRLLKAIKAEVPQIPLGLILSNREIGFHLIDLPDNFYDLSTFYIDRKCELCMDHSEIGSKCVCLICEQVLCSYTCKKGQKVDLGNLNTHAVKYHVGCSAFLSVESGCIFLVNSPKNIDYGPLYIDKFGQKFNEKRSNWRNFNIDQVMFNKIKEVIQKSTVPQEVSYRVIKMEKKFIDGIL